ncbi:MAG: hydantoinase/oxoprolinase family protein, partial [Pseudomonadota bacterium]
DLSIGIGGAIAAVLPKAAGQLIELVSLSTTLATNAIVEGEGEPVCLILAGFRDSHLARQDLRDTLLGQPIVLIDGGHGAHGSALHPLDVEALERAVAEHAPAVSAFAVSSVFAVRNPEHEIEMRDTIARLSGLPVSCGHQLSAALDAPRRALTAAINARLLGILDRLLGACRDILDRHAITAPLMVVKGDGSLISSEVAAASPVETILSGPAASLVGASHLSGAKTVYVSDMGGTTTDVARLVAGRPRLDPQGALVGGHRTMVEAVHVQTYGLGGDSLIQFNRDSKDLDIGPRRAVPVSLLAREYQSVLPVLRQQAENPWPRTWDGQFVLRKRALPESMRLSPKQRAVWDRLGDGPVALSDVFEDQTLDHTLARLEALGLVIKSGFTPSDACHVLGLHTAWDSEAAELAANAVRRYAEGNLGPRWASVQALCEHVREAVATLTANCLVHTALGDTLSPGQPGHDGKVPLAQQALIDLGLTPPADASLSFTPKLHDPVVALGAPVANYYPAVGARLQTEVIVPEHAHVANAVGAVVGVVRQRASATISALDRSHVRAHAPSGQRDFDDLEAAAAWCRSETEAHARALARAAGSHVVDIDTERDDNVVEKDGERVFFGSHITSTATGRPATLQEPAA